MMRVWQNHHKVAKSYDKQFGNLYDVKVVRYTSQIESPIHPLLIQEVITKHMFYVDDSIDATFNQKVHNTLF